jgi:hypothetical protein
MFKPETAGRQAIHFTVCPQAIEIDPLLWDRARGPAGI